MTGGIRFNSNHGHENFLMAKSKASDPYIPGPIHITNQESFWVLASIYNESANPADVARNVRISMNVTSYGYNLAIVGGIILCDNSNPIRVESEIEFNSEAPFSLEYYRGSAYLYSSAYGLHSDYGMKLSDDIIKPEGAMIGYKKPDGLIPGGENNAVTVSIKVRVVR